MRHRERHRTAHIGWLRAAVLGANDGLISTASLVIGVASIGRGALRVAFWGAIAMAASALVGRLFGTTVA
ncbi:MAG TPA: hypothetical protein PK788_01335 [Gemmatimonadaceae bacterium]|nr:hypothetical protein [Gemmatimonadaceae bacterium]HRQ77535.1 hypothetical protein [Gemmatimonadaceae bacterium]